MGPVLCRLTQLVQEACESSGVPVISRVQGHPRRSTRSGVPADRGASCGNSWLATGRWGHQETRCMTGRAGGQLHPFAPHSSPPPPHAIAAFQQASNTSSSSSHPLSLATSQPQNRMVHKPFNQTAPVSLAASLTTLLLPNGLGTFDSRGWRRPRSQRYRRSSSSTPSPTPPRSEMSFEVCHPPCLRSSPHTPR